MAEDFEKYVRKGWKSWVSNCILLRILQWPHWFVCSGGTWGREKFGKKNLRRASFVLVFGLLQAVCGFHLLI